MKDLKVVINGAGAAGQAIAKLILERVSDVVVLDSTGVINKDRADLDKYKKEISETTNKENISGNIKEAIKGADVFIGVSKANLLNSEDIKTMAKDAIVFAMANPIPEIMPDEAKKGGARIIATGRSDMPNQVNNSLAFPGIFKGALKIRATKITKDMKIAAAEALAQMIQNPTEDKIIPGPFDNDVAEKVAQAVMNAS